MFTITNIDDLFVLAVFLGRVAEAGGQSLAGRGRSITWGLRLSRVPARGCPSVPWALPSVYLS